MTMNARHRTSFARQFFVFALGAFGIFTRFVSLCTRQLTVFLGTLKIEKYVFRIHLFGIPCSDIAEMICVHKIIAAVTEPFATTMLFWISFLCLDDFFTGRAFPIQFARGLGVFVPSMFDFQMSIKTCQRSTSHVTFFAADFLFPYESAFPCLADKAANFALM